MIENGRSSRPPRVCLHSGASVLAAWENVVFPWFQRVSASWQDAKPAGVIIPSRSHALFFRKRLLDNDIALLGVLFLTPPAARELLLRGIKTPWRENLRLLLSIAAEEEPDSSTAKSVANSPDSLLRAIEQLGAAGSDFDDVGTPELRPIAKRFRGLLRRCDFQLTYEVDRTADPHASQRPPLFSDLLITGFDGAHWPLWPLLRASAQAAERATVVLTDPRDESRDLDEAWIGTWEENFAAAKPIGTKTARHETLFPELFETQSTDRDDSVLTTKPHFLVGRDLNEQGKAIVALVRHFLAGEDARRIGILFPSPGGLHRLVASLLTEINIPHHDGIAHLAPGPLDDEAWHAWLDLQENPRLRIFCRFLHALPDVALLFGELPAEEIENILGRAYRDLLIDDLDLLREYCARRTDRPETKKVVAGLSAIQFLPERATLAEYLAQTRTIFLRFDWTERWQMVESATLGWSKNVTGKLSHVSYLRWLSQITASFFPARDATGDHPYSRVQLLFYSQAEGQDWSHLIFAACNEGSWPPREDESGFLSDEEIEAVNKQIPRLNRRIVREGRQGEGHTIATEGKTFCIGPSERRHLALRQFRNLVESAASGIGITATLVEESAPERLSNPSEFFAQFYYEARNETLSQATMFALQNQTRMWLEKEFPPGKSASSADVEQTKVAYQARRASNKTFSEFEFALSKSPHSAIQLSATAWEGAIKSPALIWLEKFLGVSATEEEFVNWNMTTGQWVHRWLRQIANPDAETGFVAKPDPAEIRKRASAAAVRFRDEVADLSARCGRALPDWWLSGWKHAVSIADCLTAIVALTEGWSHFATEWTLPFHSIRLGDDEQFSIKGRIDLLLARAETPNESLPFSDMWVVDYKTGTKKSLAPKKTNQTSAEEQLNIRLRKGHGVQLALYALALRELGASEIAVSLFARDAELDRPQIGIKEIAAQGDIWRELARMGATGIFGMRGAIRAEFAFRNPYPLATLSIDPDLLEEKWSLTHPALTRPEVDEW